jgi:endonuclease-3
VVLNTAFGQPTMAVDTHIFRVANRTGIAPGKDVLEVEENSSNSPPNSCRTRTTG